MRVLIVDDNPRRHAKLLETLVPGGLPRDSIDIRVSANDAREALRNSQYDLMIIDILIPLRAEEDPSERHSIDLLTEIVEFGELNKPRLIVGITADRQVARRVEPVFKAWLWAIIPYSEDNESWIDQIQNCVNYIAGRDKEPSRREYGIDVLIVCALEDPELRAILRLPWSWSAPRPVDDTIFVHDGAFLSGGAVCTVAATSCSRMGMVAAALVTARLVEALRPRLVVMAGICAGIRGKASLGDVLLADPCWDWQSGKRERYADRSVFAVAPHQLGVDPKVRARFERLRAERSLLSAIADGWNGEVPGQLKLVVGPVASGSAVMADQKLLDEIKQQHRETCGIEMEAYGVYAAASSAPAPRPLFFSAKAVCDFADEAKADDFQTYAAYTSARAAQEFLERFMVDFR